MAHSSGDSGFGGDVLSEHYERAFEYNRERAELAKLKAKYGSDAEEDDLSESDSESDESEDEQGEELTPAVDAAILRTLARIKRKDPAIYDAEKGIFQEEESKTATKNIATRTVKPKDKSKPVTMRQVVLESALNQDADDSRSPTPEPVPHAEEQKALRNETIAVFNDAVDDDDDIFVPRAKTKSEQELEEEEYKSFLQREVGEELKDLVTVEADETGVLDSGEVNASVENVKKTKRSNKGKEKASTEEPSAAKQEADQEFLMNYILNRGWIDRTSNHVPTYGEVTQSHPKKTKSKARALEDAADSGKESDFKAEESDNGLDEEDFDEIADRFEVSYNFRFEEPGADGIKSYPRNLPSLVRREDTTRKDARERKKQRKEEELLKKREEVKRMKALKLKQLRSKLERIGMEGGKSLEEDQALRELDLDGDWDPDAHDEQMAGLYGQDDDFGDDKPQWDEDIDMGGIVVSEDELEPSVDLKKKKKKKKKKGGDQEDEGVDIDAMDADVEPLEGEEWDGTEEMRKRKLAEYMDEIYALDFNDMVGDMRTRFKYVPVPKQNFALTPAEILMATDQELNEYMSVKKYAPYRQEAKWDSTRGDRLRDLKQKVGERVPEEFRETAMGERPAKKRMGKKERMKLKGDEEEEPRTQTDSSELKRKRDEEEDETVSGDLAVSGKKKRRRQKKKDAAAA